MRLAGDGLVEVPRRFQQWTAIHGRGFSALQQWQRHRDARWTCKVPNGGSTGGGDGLEHKHLPSHKGSRSIEVPLELRRFGADAAAATSIAAQQIRVATVRISSSAPMSGY